MLIRRISSFENGDIGKPILCEMRLSSSFMERFSDRVLDLRDWRLQLRLRLYNLAVGQHDVEGVCGLASA